MKNQSIKKNELVSLLNGDNKSVSKNTLSSKMKWFYN